MESITLGFIGGGRITKIFLQSIENKNLIFKSIVVCDTDLEVVYKLKKQYPRIQISDCDGLAATQDVVFIALHPPLILDVLCKINDFISKDTQVISFAPKISIDKLSKGLSSKKIARMIPNATSFINEGINPICFSKGYIKQEIKSTKELLSFTGNIFEVEESKLEAYAILSAMLPTYFWFQFRELQKLGPQMGLNSVETKQSIKQTLIAAIDMYYNSDLSYEELIDLIPVKPISDHEDYIRNCFSEKLLGLYQKIKS